MISIPLLLQTTLILILGLLLLVVSKKSDPAFRHLLCCVTLVCCMAVKPLSTVATWRTPYASTLSFTEHAVTATSRAYSFDLRWLTWIWIAGALFVLGRYAVGFLVLAAESRKAERFVKIDELLARKLQKRKVDVRMADVTTPVIWGMFHPVILVPRVALTWPQSRLRLALLHELAHVERRDLWTALISVLAQAAYWFHPLVWWLSAKTVEEQERACDDKVLQAGVPAVEYAGLLVDIARHLQSPVLFGCAMVRTTYSLRGRIMYILQERQTSRGWRTRITGLLASFTLAAALWAFAPVHGDNPPAEGGTIYKVGDGVQAPHIISKVTPRYPKDAKERKVQGVVVLSVTIDKSGVPQDIEILKTPDPSLGQAAIEAVQQWRFEPGTKQGEAVSVRANIEINFQLKD